MQNFQYREVILHYLSGHMTPQEVTDFEAKASNNPDLAAELAEIMAIQEGLEQLNVPKTNEELNNWAELARQSNTAETAAPSPVPVMRVQYLRWSAAAAAAVALLIGVWWFIQPSKQIDLAHYIAQSAQQASNIGGDIAGMDHDSTALREQVKNMFTKGKYVELLVFVESLPDTALIGDEVLLYKAKAKLSINPPDYPEAYNELKVLADDERVFEVIRMQATYDMALCKVGMNDKAAAIELLKSLVTQTVSGSDKTRIQGVARESLAAFEQ